MKNAIYLDYNATTPCDPRVVEKMLPFFAEWYGNPATGLHLQGRKAARAVNEAREHVAALINCRPGELIFTAGATESNNLSILGLGRAHRHGERKRIVTSAIEHKAVLLPYQKLQEEGYELIVLPVDPQGRVSVDEAEAAINDQTLLVSVQAANNEVGALQPIAEIAKIAHAHGAIVHCDAAQAVGKIPVDLAAEAWQVDLLSISAHKLYGPKGVGALYVRSGPRTLILEPLQYGGGQERGLRPGTTNVPGIVGFGEACRICSIELAQESIRIANLRDRFEQALLAGIPGLKINAREALRLPNTSSLTFPDIDADALLLNLPEVMMGTGAACSSGALEPSHVLTAMGLSRAEARSTVRVSLGRFTTLADVERACSLIVNVLTILEASQSKMPTLKSP
ncbi:cysteine desulfurase family protein [Caldilinea sp.]|uniref:cysteine desulfurase family protein n=1 Tax=Caldilinea sp. TaxID=2293560 RepID=UPI0021DD7704|nr:cysteine desulfurase family protein [Caldilinea sp.]GIV67864.1 MAG: cysteine desulfurase [Caldilinea sp.]